MKMKTSKRHLSQRATNRDPWSWNRAVALSFTAILLMFYNASATEPAAKPTSEKTGWKLTFQDEFDGPALDDRNWFASYRVGMREYLYRTGKTAEWFPGTTNYVIEDGVLKLRVDEKLPVRKKREGYVASSIQTSEHFFSKDGKTPQIMDKFAQKYGWFEIRSRMPGISGLCCAFWLLHSDPLDQEIAPNGSRRKLGDGVVEIDIFELLGSRRPWQVIDFNVHFTKDGHCKHALGFNADEDFHVYALEWLEGELNWYVDGKKAYTYKGETPQKEMFILLGLYHGSDWIGKLDPNISYPVDFEIDYVRVYEKVDIR